MSEETKFLEWLNNIDWKKTKFICLNEHFFKYIEKDCLRLFIKEYGDVVSMIDEAVRVGLRKW